MVDAKYRGDECPRCLRPEPSQIAWDELSEGEGEGLCWDSGLTCPDRRGEEIARLRTETARLRKALKTIERKLVDPGEDRLEAIWFMRDIATAALSESNGDDT